MPDPILATKLYIPSPRSNVVHRPRLIERLNDGSPVGGQLTIISAPAGFGKTTLISEWIATGKRAAWLSLDEGDNDLNRFLIYFVTALQTIFPNLGEEALGMLQSQQPPSSESILTTLLNEIASLPENFILVLDDYHLIDARPVDLALGFLLDHLPRQMHLVITTREDPSLPIARYRARGCLTELRAADLRFTPAEAADFLNQVMSLNLSVEEITALETRTEGWIAGLQLAAFSMQGHPDTTGFIQSFTGNHRFVLDYLLEEVLNQQSESIQKFLMRTSILERMCAPLCDAVLLDPSISGQEALEYLDCANLFIVPLDNERRWYRYHHLFADLLRQRLQRSATLNPGDDQSPVSAMHARASQWYEDNSLEIEAFHHATAANDIERVERLLEGAGMPLTFRGGSVLVLHWLASLPTSVLDARPSLWVAYAAALLFTGQNTAVEQKLLMAEAALSFLESDIRTRDLVGRIALLRATLAVIARDVDTIIAQSRRALDYLRPDNLVIRTATTWSLGYAYQLNGNRAGATQAYTEVISTEKSLGDSVYSLAATLSLGQVQETDNRLHQAAESYRRALQLAGDPPRLMASEIYLGLARLFYEWNDLDAAQEQFQKSVPLAQQMEKVDTPISCGIFLARLKLAQGDIAGAGDALNEAEEFARRHHFVSRMPDIAAAQVILLLRRGDLAKAEDLAQMYQLTSSKARIHLARGSPSEAIVKLDPLRHNAEAKEWQDERLNVMVLQAVSFHALGEKERAVQILYDALALAESGGFIRLFVDEGAPIAQLLSEAAHQLGVLPNAQGGIPGYIRKLLIAFELEQSKFEGKPDRLPTQPHDELLSQREIEVLQLIAQGFSNHEIGEKLFLALDTVKGHNRRIFDKLQVQRRTEAILRARELGLI
jgi:LuxR family transcriptional regulator, maltose regulon positive regulatory protein